jgi:hypothetical protein
VPWVGTATPDSVRRNALQFHSEKVIKPDSNPAGYSGYTVFVRSGGANANKAEIQINYVAMMYAKSLDEFRKSKLGPRESEMKTRFLRVPGGAGHPMYEVWRRQQQTSIGKAHAAACKLYYDYFRSEPPNVALGEAAIEAMRPLNLPNILLPPPALHAAAGPERKPNMLPPLPHAGAPLFRR